MMKEKMVKDEMVNKVAAVDETEEQEWFSWTAAERPYKERDRDFWITAVSILVLVGIIFVLVGEMFLVIALASVLFLFYVLSTIPPENVVYRIGSRGIYFGDLHYGWDDLERFWFRKTLSCDAIFFETKLRFPREVSLIINKKDEENIKVLVKKRLPLIASTPTFVDKLTKWFGDRLPLESRDEKKGNK